jgi:acetyl esterase
LPTGPDGQWLRSSTGLAPEYPYPCGLRDALDATEWLAGNDHPLRARPGPTAIAGDSAGSNLAAVVARKVTERGSAQLAAQVLVYPVTDAAMDTNSFAANATGYNLTADAMRRLWERYVPNAMDRLHPDVSPLRARDLGGLPPGLVIVADLDPLLDEGEAYAAALRDAGVPVRLIRFEGLIHGFFRMPAVLSHAETAYRQVAAFLQEAAAG